MRKNVKWIFFYDPKINDYDEMIKSVEEEINKEEISENFNSFLMSEIDNNFDLPMVFFEDQGIIYGFSENIYFSNKLQSRH